MTLTERLERARECRHASVEGVSLLVPISPTHARCWGCQGVVAR